MRPLEVNLWPGAAPGSEHLRITETIVERKDHRADRPDRSRHGVTQPRLSCYLPRNPNGTAMLIAPGGGYQRLVFDKEGAEPARWLNTLGISVFVLDYRLPGEGHHQAKWVALQDAQRAIRLIRHWSAKFRINPAKVGAMGFSAGGHVVACLATRFDQASYRLSDDAEAQSARPDFIVLDYPVISMQEECAHFASRLALLGTDPTQQEVEATSCEFHVKPDTPPTFIALADDDSSVIPENSIRFYLALHESRVPVQMHIYQRGGHGFGLRLKKQMTAGWTHLCAKWMCENGWL